MVNREEDTIQRRLVVECGLRYVYLYVADGNGKVLDEDAFTQPYRLERKECVEEVEVMYGILYDHLNDTINFPTAGNGGPSDKPE